MDRYSTFVRYSAYDDIINIAADLHCQGYHISNYHAQYISRLIMKKSTIKTLTQIQHKKKSIGRTVFEAMCKDQCAICLNIHTKGECIETECGHEFGKQCWETWISNPNGNHTCPTCREFRPLTTSFKIRIRSKKRSTSSMSSSSTSI